MKINASAPMAAALAVATLVWSGPSLAQDSLAQNGVAPNNVTQDSLTQDSVTHTAPPVLTTPAPPPPVATGIRSEPLADVPLLGVATAAPTCGDIPLSAPVSCVTAPLSAMSVVSEAYIDHYKDLGWLAADGDDNRIVLIRRRDGGGCDAIQMIAFYDTTRPDGPTVPGYLGFATIPGDICSAPPAGPPAALPVPTQAPAP